MAVKDVKPVGKNAARAICLMAAQTANNAVPTLSTDGVPNYPDDQIFGSDTGACYSATPASSSTLLVKGTVTAGQTLTGTLTLWGYLVASGQWYEIPLNGGTGVTPIALAETDTDVITYRERLLDLGHFDRLYLQLTGIGGSGASFDAWLVTSRTVSY